MKIQQIRKIISVFAAICIIAAANPVYADITLPDVDSVWRDLSGIVPASARDYVYGKLPEIFDSTVSFARDIKEDNFIEYYLELGAPYIIYNFEEYQDEIYYYPLIADGKTEFLLAVIGTDMGYTYELSMGGEMIYLLNELNYPDNDCLFYVIDGELCYETKNGGECNPDLSAVYRTDSRLDGEKLLFAAKSFEEKQRIISDKISAFKPVTPVQMEQEELDNLEYGKIIQLRSPQRQYNTEMCWACVVAGIVNTLNWTYYTGYDICNRMGIGFYSGGDVEDMKLALSYYSVDYKRTDDCISWENMKKNIDAGYPVAVLTVDTSEYKTGHTVTLMGYEQGKKYSENYMYFWDSADYVNSETKVPDMEENYHMTNYGSYMYFASVGIAYQWIQTLSYY